MASRQTKFDTRRKRDSVGDGYDPGTNETSVAKIKAEKQHRQVEEHQNLHTGEIEQKLVLLPRLPVPGFEWDDVRTVLVTSNDSGYGSQSGGHNSTSRTREMKVETDFETHVNRCLQCRAINGMYEHRSVLCLSGQRLARKVERTFYITPAGQIMSWANRVEVKISSGSVQFRKLLESAYDPTSIISSKVNPNFPWMSCRRVIEPSQSSVDSAPRQTMMRLSNLSNDRKEIKGHELLCEESMENVAHPHNQNLSLANRDVS